MIEGALKLNVIRVLQKSKPMHILNITTLNPSSVLKAQDQTTQLAKSIKPEP